MHCSCCQGCLSRATCPSAADVHSLLARVVLGCSIHELGQGPLNRLNTGMMHSMHPLHYIRGGSLPLLRMQRLTVATSTCLSAAAAALAAAFWAAGEDTIMLWPQACSSSSSLSATCWAACKPGSACRLEPHAASRMTLGAIIRTRPSALWGVTDEFGMS